MAAFVGIDGCRAGWFTVTLFDEARWELKVFSNIQETWDSLSDAKFVLIDIHGLTQEAIDAKDRALLWIFAIEWLVVSGTSILAGFLVWTLMVRRALYREVRITRLIES